VAEPEVSAPSARLFAHWRTQVPLAVSLVVVVALAFVVFHYFLVTFTVAGSVALMLARVQRGLVRRLGGRRWAAAGVLVVLVTVAIAIPVLACGSLVAQQAIAFVEWLRPWLEPQALEKLLREDLPARFPLLMVWVRQSTGDAGMPVASSVLSRVASELNHVAQSLFTSLATGLLDLMIFLMLLFFLLRDGEELRDAVRGVSPLTRAQETEIMDHLARTVKGVLQSMVIVPVVQGLAALCGFWALGLPSPLLWASLVIFAALLPIVGSPLIWVPAAVYLWMKVSLTKGIALAVYGVLVISVVDNVLKPLILRGAAQIHTMLGFLSILGGVYAFGAKGLIVGPVALSLILSAYRIYRYDVLRWRHEPPATGGGLPAEPPEAGARATAGREEVPALSTR
jgi:predicted PurR-regulated permease PerM